MWCEWQQLGSTHSQNAKKVGRDKALLKYVWLQMSKVLLYITSTFNEEVFITALQCTVSRSGWRWETLRKENHCFRKLTFQLAPESDTLSEVQRSISASLSSKTDLKLQDFSHSPRPGCLAGPRQVGTPTCQLSANFPLYGLVGCVLPPLWAADLTELVARATASAKDPPLCFPWRPDTLIIWGIAEDVGGVWSGCQMSFWSTGVLSKEQKWEKKKKCHQCYCVLPGCLFVTRSFVWGVFFLLIA